MPNTVQAIPETFTEYEFVEPKQALHEELVRKYDRWHHPPARLPSGDGGDKAPPIADDR